MTPQELKKDCDVCRERVADRFNKLEQRLTLKQEIAARKRSIGWLSASWILRGWRSRRDGQNAFFKAYSRTRKQIGEAIVRTAKGQQRPQVRLSSFLKGALIQNRERGLVRKAMRAQTADMRRYIARKQRERFLEVVRKGLPGG